MNILANLTIRQRIAIITAAILAGAALYGLVRWKKEADFRPLYTGLSPEDAASVVQKLKAGGAEYRLDENGTVVLAPSAKVAEYRLEMAAAGLPKTGRIGFELFDKTNLGATEFAEHVNYRRALEGELERSIMSMTEVQQARVHLTFAKDSVFLDERRPAKASVLVRLRPGARLAAHNVLAIDHLVASAVDGLSPDAVSVLDMNGNLLGKPKPPVGPDGLEADSEAALDYRRRAEADLLAKINSTLEPLLGSQGFRAGASVECDFSGSEQSEEIYDPARSVMLSSQRSEDRSGQPASNGVPGTASTLPRPTSRPGSGSAGFSRVTENITYQSSRTIRKTRVPAGTVTKLSLAVLVDQAVTWEKSGKGYRRVLAPPAPEKLKVIRDLVAGVTGFDAARGDQLIVETLPFETTLMSEPPQPQAPAPVTPAPLPIPLPLDQRTMYIAGGVLVLLLLMVAGGLRFRRPRSKPAVEATGAPALPGGEMSAPAATQLETGPTVEQQLEAKLAERDALQRRMESQALNMLNIAPPITKTAEVLAKHLREKIKEEPAVAAHILQSWIREEDN